MERRIMRSKRTGNAYLQAFLFLLVLSSFFDAIIVPIRTFKLIGMTLLLYYFVKSRWDVYHIKLLIGIVWIMIMGSVVYSYIVNKQQFFDVMFASYFAMGLTFFCICDGLKLTYKQSLKLLVNFSTLFCVCYIIQWVIYPITIFAGSLDEFSISDTQFRMRMACSGCSYCLFFYGINAFLKSRGIKNILYIVLGFLPLFIMGFRSLIALTLLFMVYLIFSYNKKNSLKSLIRLVAFSSIFLMTLQIPFVQDKIDEMVDRQENGQNFDNKDYVRYAALDYYWQVFDTPAEKIFGGGYPMTTSSNPNWSCDYLKEINRGYQYQLFWNDLGLIGFAFIFGFPSVLLISFLVFRTIVKFEEPKHLFIRCTLLTIYLGSIITSQEFFRSGNFLIIGLIIYIEYKYHLENNENRNFNISSC